MLPAFRVARSPFGAFMGESTTFPLRVVTAAALFDGHDAAINLVRRLLVAQGAQVIHLGHNRSVEEVVKAAVEEDAHAVCVSSYQGGHVEFFTYLAQRLRELGAGHIKLFGGGGGVILPEEIAAVEGAGVEKIYTPEDGMRLGVEGMIADLLARVRSGFQAGRASSATPLWSDRMGLSAALSAALEGTGLPGVGTGAPVVGLTGTGGAGKSSLTDELVRRFLQDFPDRKLAVLALDPTRKRSGGALLGDRLRMNTAGDPRVFFRSIASGAESIDAVRRGVALLRGAGVDLILVETTGIGQGDTDITEMSDLPVYVMTREYGAGTQLEKINMLDYAQLVVINKFEDKRAEDALQAVRRQLRRNRGIPATTPDEALPVYGTAAGRFNDAGVDRFYLDLLHRLEELGGAWSSRLSDPGALAFSCERGRPIIPADRDHYLQDIVHTVRAYKAHTHRLVAQADRLQALETVADELDLEPLNARREELRGQFGPEGQALLEGWDRLKCSYADDQATTATGIPLASESLSGLSIRKVELPPTDRWGEQLRFLRQEQVPGFFPFTAGVFPFRRSDEEPKRQFAGEGGPERTNRRFHFLCQGEKAKRLSTAFDSVTLYGEDPAERPDIFGKIGESGVSIATLEDMKTLYRGFDLCDPNTSVSMTINGPAPVVLAMFFNTAIDQQLEQWRVREGCAAVPPEVAAKIKADTLCQLRGTVQADILKEDQAQNTCIFSIEFALRMMGDVQAFLIQNRMRNYYSVSISGYHIAEAGANPVTQLAFTLANGFTLVEYFLSRGMAIEEVAPNLSFFFSSGLDPEYSVIGRVARRIWAIAMRERYGAQEKACKLKYHVQTSGRSLHLKEMKFNDIRTTLQAFTALSDNCNSLHTNAYDEALTTPTEESVRIAMAIQLILTREFGPYRNENGLQGSYFIQKLTDQVEEAVLEEFLALGARGGVLRAMETQYQRLKIQEQSLHYETLKHSGEYPVVGVNTFQRAEEGEVVVPPISRASTEEKQARLDHLADFHARHAAELDPVLERLRAAVRRDENVFEVLMDAVRVASLGQITEVLYEMGGRYRRAI